MKMNFCPQCGNPLHNNSNFCGKCGFQLREKNPENTVQTFEKSSEQAKPKKSKSSLYWISGVVLILLSAAAFVFYYIDSSSESEDLLSVEVSEIEGESNNTSGISDYAPEPDLSSTFGTHEVVIGPKNPVFSHKGVKIKLDAAFLDREIGLKVTPQKMANNLEGISYNAFAFELTPGVEYQGLFEIRIPYKNSGSQTIAGAGYFNPKTGKWEPVLYELDRARREFVITTDHLSVYSCFWVEGDGTSMARIQGVLDLMPQGNYENQYQKILQEAAADNMGPGQAALDMGFEITGEWLGLSGNALGVTLSTGYDSKFLDDLSNAMVNVGLAFAIVQFASDITKGEKKAGVLGFTKALVDFGLAKLGTAAMQTAMVGVFAIDYSLGKFIKEAISGREEFYRKVYKLYYSDAAYPSKGFALRDTDDWYYVFLKILDESRNPGEASQRIEESIDDYVEHIWKDVNGLSDAYGEAGGKSGYLGWLNDDLEKRLSANYKAELINSDLVPVFDNLARKNLIRQFQNYREAMEKVKNKLNQTVDFRLEEEAVNGKLNYPGYLVQFEPLAPETNAEQWSGVIKEDGTYRGKFTILGHLMAGAPNKIKLYKDRQNFDAGKPERVIEFRMGVPLTRVVIRAEEKYTVSILGGNIEYQLKKDQLEYKHSFEARSSVPGAYRFEWSFGDGRVRNETPLKGSGSKVKNTFKQGRFTVNVKLVNLQDGKVLATDKVLVSVIQAVVKGTSKPKQAEIRIVKDPGTETEKLKTGQKKTPSDGGYWKRIDVINDDGNVVNKESDYYKTFNTCSNGSAINKIITIEGGRVLTSAKWTQPPQVIFPTDNVTISLSISMDEYKIDGEREGCCPRFTGSHISANFDEYDVGFGRVTANEIEFKNSNGKDFLEVKGEWGIITKGSASDNFSAMLGEGPDTSGYKRVLKIGMGFGTKYIYEWIPPE